MKCNKFQALRLWAPLMRDCLAYTPNGGIASCGAQVVALLRCSSLCCTAQLVALYHCRRRMERQQLKWKNYPFSWTQWYAQKIENLFTIPSPRVLKVVFLFQWDCEVCKNTTANLYVVKNKIAVWKFGYCFIHGHTKGFLQTLRQLWELRKSGKNNKGIKTILVLRILKDTLHHTAKIMSDCCKK